MAGSIVVDTNAGENALYEALLRRFDGSTVQRRKLDVGDVVLSAESGTLVVERKTWLDWAKSMTDGRYASQKARLRSLMAAAAADDDEEEDGGGGVHLGHFAPHQKARHVEVVNRHVHKQPTRRRNVRRRRRRGVA